MTRYLLPLLALVHRFRKPKAGPAPMWTAEEIAALNGMAFDISGKRYPITIYHEDGTPLAVLRGDGMAIEPAARQ